MRLLIVGLLVTLPGWGEDLLDKHFAAIGGAQRLNQVQTRVSEGTLEMPGGRAALTIWQKAPDRAVLELRLPGGTIRRGFDGASGWEDSTRSGPRAMAPTAQKAFAEEHALSARTKEQILAKYPKRTPAGANQLRLTPQDGSAPELWTFDPDTHLLTRINREVDAGPQGIVPVTVILADYRKVGDLLLPHTVQTKTSVSTVTLRLDSVREGEPLSDALFAPKAQQP
ncbi:MAG TPA: hypothetical protein VER03_23820 [Bryobacteraceae bacterium]|nr:hypothetical protein [Bryobacteraceae bacterium]